MMKKYPRCDECGKTFSRKDNLERHKATHLQRLMHFCDVCEKSFTRKSYLKVHKRSHTGEKPYACTICGCAFARDDHLIRHRRKHHVEKVYTCVEGVPTLTINDLQAQQPTTQIIECAEEEQEALHQESLQQEALHQESLQQEALHQESLQEALHQESLQQEALHQETLQEALHQQSLQQEALHQQSLQQEALHQESLQEALHQESLQQEALHQESLQQEALHQDQQSLHQDALHQELLHQEAQVEHQEHLQCCDHDSTDIFSHHNQQTDAAHEETQVLSTTSTSTPVVIKHGKKMITGTIQLSDQHSPPLPLPLHFKSDSDVVEAAAAAAAVIPTMEEQNMIQILPASSSSQLVNAVVVGCGGCCGSCNTGDHPQEIITDGTLINACCLKQEKTDEQHQQPSFDMTVMTPDTLPEKPPKRGQSNSLSFCCQICGRMFSRRDNLERHKLVHEETRVNPFSCEVCGKSFSRKSYLKVHGRIHSGERPYQCSICGFAFARYDHLLKHNKLTKGRRKLSCIPHFQTTEGNSSDLTSNIDETNCQVSEIEEQLHHEHHPHPEDTHHQQLQHITILQDGTFATTSSNPADGQLTENRIFHATGPIVTPVSHHTVTVGGTPITQIFHAIQMTSGNTPVFRTLQMAPTTQIVTNSPQLMSPTATTHIFTNK